MDELNKLIASAQINQEQAQKEMKELKEAYEALTEDEKLLVSKLFGDFSQLPIKRGTNRTPKKKKRKK
jgi:DnaJ-class molecular chaperone